MTDCDHDTCAFAPTGSLRTNSSSTKMNRWRYPSNGALKRSCATRDCAATTFGESKRWCCLQCCCSYALVGLSHTAELKRSSVPSAQRTPNSTHPGFPSNVATPLIYRRSYDTHPIKSWCTYRLQLDPVLLAHGMPNRRQRRLHCVHTLLNALAIFQSVDEYEAVRASYNSVRPVGSLETPTFKERRGVSDICDHAGCRYLLHFQRCAGCRCV